MINDHVSDMLARIRNAQRAGHKFAAVTASKMNKSVLAVLQTEGLIDGFETIEEAGKVPVVKVSLRYFAGGKPVISRAERVSKAGCRKYASSDNIPRVKSGLGLAIVSTSKGVMSDHEARKLRVGGEVIALFG